MVHGETSFSLAFRHDFAAESCGFKIVCKLCKSENRVTVAHFNEDKSYKSVGRGAFVQRSSSNSSSSKTDDLEDVPK